MLNTVAFGQRATRGASALETGIAFTQGFDLFYESFDGYASDFSPDRVGPYWALSGYVGNRPYEGKLWRLRGSLMARDEFYVNGTRVEARYQSTATAWTLRAQVERMHVFDSWHSLGGHLGFTATGKEFVQPAILLQGGLAYERHWELVTLRLASYCEFANLSDVGEDGSPEEIKQNRNIPLRGGLELSATFPFFRGRWLRNATLPPVIYSPRS